ncbi:hypothetical protein F2Q69_00024633 [Brassica cretica]|uniref:Uncharacterized protein n=1 Tax=Brassica cretica TaxID=69181 RepID=A0A8S9QUV2_BRACR|nr:hypothetical protein F2Q69_00024633 [Brassica cretica]
MSLRGWGYALAELLKWRGCLGRVNTGAWYPCLDLSNDRRKFEIFNFRSSERGITAGLFFSCGG